MGAHHPPTFVPRHGSTDPDDGYVITIVHRGSVPRPSSYRIGWRRDARGALAAFPGHVRRFAATGTAFAAQATADRAASR